jgi:hypothetical protein
VAQRKKTLTQADLVKHIVASCPLPQRFKGDPESTTLGTLGLSASTARGFVRGFQAKIRPWHIDSNMVVTGKELTVQQAAISIEQMVSKPPLDPDDLIKWIVASSPLPNRYEGDPTIKLGILGVNGTTAHGFVAGIQQKILPWLVNEGDVVVASSKTVQDCAFSVNLHAY